MKVDVRRKKIDKVNECVSRSLYVRCKICFWTKPSERFMIKLNKWIDKLMCITKVLCQMENISEYSLGSGLDNME